MINYKINWNLYKYSEEQLREAIASSTSFSETIFKLGITKTGQYYPVKKLIEVLKIDTSHFKRIYSRSVSQPKPLEDVLKENVNYASHRLRKRLVAAGIFENKCFICGASDWLGHKLSLHLDHINGVHDDNRLENLRLLCPNCHSCTPTYCGKNKKIKFIENNKYRLKRPANISINEGVDMNRKRPLSIKNTPKYCLDCQKKIKYSSNRCKSCTGRVREGTKINWPSVKELQERLKTTSYLQLGKELGVSDNAIRKRIKNYSDVENSLPSQEESSL